MVEIVFLLSTGSSQETCTLLQIWDYISDPLCTAHARTNILSLLFTIVWIVKLHPHN